ncbi:hypothetical protein GALL_461850 [mine drainage metagenome]|uniref:Uncharacterized protein n=1 Tax=mine drainage metagenome TaxID=410659 RepID=A0A1J5Q8B6_9ZZZZ
MQTNDSTWRQPPGLNDPHHTFYQCIASGGRVWRNDPLNGIQEWIDLERLEGDPTKIMLYGHKDLSIPA